MLFLTFSSAYLLVSHGSRDPRHHIAIDHLAKLVEQRLQAVDLRTKAGIGIPTPSTRQSLQQHSLATQGSLGTAVLELAPLPLHRQIEQFAESVQARGYNHVQILPLFLLPGVHVVEDIPAEVAIARQVLEPDITLEVCPYLGSHPQLKTLLTHPIDPVATSPTAGKILLSHGSRRPEGNRRVENLAVELGASPAYWSVEPSLETQVIELVKKGCREIAILPYFLFEGGITDAIADQVSHLAQQFPYVHLHLSKPIGATPQLADLVLDLMARDS